jgi:hypothetical protein
MMSDQSWRRVYESTTLFPATLTSEPEIDQKPGDLGTGLSNKLCQSVNLFRCPKRGVKGNPSVSL